MIIYVEKKNTNCRKLPVNYSKIINDYSCVFLIIHVEKKKNTNAHKYTRIRKNKFMKNSWVIHDYSC